MISYSTLQHPLVGDLLLLADEHRLLRSSYLDANLAPKLARNGFTIQLSQCSPRRFRS